MSIIAVARDQAGDLLRRRYLMVILFLGLGVTGLYIGYLYFMQEIALNMVTSPKQAGPRYQGYEAGAMMQLGMTVLQSSLHGLVAFMATILSLLLMCYSVRGEITRGTVRMVLSRPVRRYEYVIGKWLGCTFTVLVYYVFMGSIVAVYTHYTAPELLPFVPASMAMGFLKAIMVGSLGMALAMVWNPLLAMAAAFFAAGETFLFIAKFLHGVPAELVKIPFYLLPSYKSLNTYFAIIQGTPISEADIAYRSAHAMLFSVLMLVLAAALFRKRDLA